MPVPLLSLAELRDALALSLVNTSPIYTALAVH